jgi:alpha-amylase/alpha-mannosidase (GH57 family)
MNKIDALKKTLHVLENDLVRYSWSGSESCNCGVLAQCVTNRTENTLNHLVSAPRVGFSTDNLGPWAKWANHCQITGIPFNDVMKTLADCGFTWNEIKHLENLSDKSIVDFPVHVRSNKEFVIRYFKAWIQKLENEQVVETKVVEPAIKTEYKVVEVDSKVKELVKQELILS